MLLRCCKGMCQACVIGIFGTVIAMAPWLQGGNCVQAGVANQHLWEASQAAESLARACR